MQIEAREEAAEALQRDDDPAPDFPPQRIARRRRLRLRVIGLIGLSYAVDSLVLLLYVGAGTTTPRTPGLYALAGGLLCAAQLAVYLSSLGERWDDPFLTVWFVVPHVILQLVFLAVAPEVGVVFLTVPFIIVGFGALRLTVQRSAIAWIVLAVCVAVALPFYADRLAIPTGTAPERWITGLFFLLTLGRCLATGAFGSLFRERLAARSAALRRSVAEIKTLRGVLPICSHCRKIRDDRGAWSDLEAYISNHSDAQFSHGICAECLRKHYPEFADKIAPE